MLQCYQKTDKQEDGRQYDVEKADGRKVAVVFGADGRPCFFLCWGNRVPLAGIHGKIHLAGSVDCRLCDAVFVGRRESTFFLALFRPGGAVAGRYPESYEAAFVGGGGLL